MAYRVATCIELHEAGVVLVANKNADCAPRGRTEYATRPAYKINLGDIAMIAEMWGIDAPRRLTRSAYTDQSFIQLSEKSASPEELEVNLYRHYYNSIEESSSIEVLTVECEVVSAHLVNIRLTEREKDDQWFEEMTYSGTFTIWWEATTAANAGAG